MGGSTDVALWADGAGGELSSVFSTTISSDAGRKVYRWDFTPQLGRNWVVRVSSAAPFQVWNARVHGRPIPNVLQPGQKFETPVIGS